MALASSARGGTRLGDHRAGVTVHGAALTGRHNHEGRLRSWHPKQVRFFLPLARACRQRAVPRASSTRDYTEVNILVDALRIAALRLGRHGGATLAWESCAARPSASTAGGVLQPHRAGRARRARQPDSGACAFGWTFPSSASVTCRKRRAVARLTLPLATRVCAPWLIPRRDVRAIRRDRRPLAPTTAPSPLAWLERHRVVTRR